MTELSVTVTAGWGSEEHNYDINYRSSLPNVLADPDNVIEMVPYVDYQEQINEIMKPYIEMKNQRTEERFRDAEKRYQAGEIKAKPSKKSFPMEDYDFAQKHRFRKIKNPRTGRMEEYPYIRSTTFSCGQHQRCAEDVALICERETAAGFPAAAPFLPFISRSPAQDSGKGRNRRSQAVPCRDRRRYV